MNEMRKLMEAVHALDEPETQIFIWNERDRAHVELRNMETDETIVEWWDEEVGEAIIDGFLDPRNTHASALQYARDMGLI